jgi:hypothetical protein
MAIQKRYFYLVLLSCVVLTVFSGCCSFQDANSFKRRDLREGDFYELRNYPLVDEYGEPKESKKPEDIQYYISKKVTLKLNSIPPPALTVDYLGNLIKYNWTVREKVTIACNDLGKLLSMDKNGYLLIGFEEDNPECFLKFGKKEDEKYYLILDDIQNSTIAYGDEVYDVSFFGRDLPNLKIKEQDWRLPYEETRQVPGWPVYR